jgi:hypothetical protein
MTTNTAELEAFKSLPDIHSILKGLDPQSVENITYIRERRFAKGYEEASQNLCTVQFEVKNKDNTSPADKYRMTIFVANSSSKNSHLAIEFTINDKCKVIANPSYDLTKKTVNLVLEMIEGSIEQSVYDISGGDLTFLD